MLFFLPRPYFKCGSYQLNEKAVHQSNEKASYAQREFQTLHLLGALGSHLSGLGVRLPPVSSLACTPPGFAPRPLRPHLTQRRYKVALTSYWNKVAWYSVHFRQFRNFKLRQAMLFFSWLIFQTWSSSSTAM